LANTDENKINKSSILKIINLIDNNQWNKVQKLLTETNSLEFNNLANWIRISSKNDINNQELMQLYNQYIDWPDINNLIVKLEKELPWKKFNEDYYVFFSRNTPISRIGKIKFSDYIKNNNDDGDQDKIIINNWIHGDFKKEDDIYIYKNYSYLFNEKINIDRLNNLIWKKQWSSVNRQIKRVDNKYKLLAKAKIKLSRRQYGVDNAVNKVPEKLVNDQGLIYERVKWRRISGLTDKSYELLSLFLNNYNGALSKPNKWWNEINWHSRNLFNQKKYDEAYKLLSHHRQNKIANIANAEWFIGWLSLNFLDKPEQAKNHFLTMENIVKMPISISRVNYWLGITEESLLNNDKAHAYYKIASKYSSTYYGLLANVKINKKSEFRVMNNTNLNNKNISNYNEILNTLKLISRADEQKYSLRFLNGVFKKKISNEEIILILNILMQENRTDLYLRACKKAIRINIYFQKCLYPYPHNIKINNINSNLEEALLLAIAKQESEFFITAKSRAGALGLVQVMPNTAKISAKEMGLKYNKDKLLNDAAYNLTIGSNYLSSLIDYYKGSLILAIASYNAGPKNVNKWIKLFGDPREQSINYINWIESIPFTETRNYVQRVLENYIVYQQVVINNAISNKKNINELF
jgi:soluble lytic murein transglycosylase